MSDTSSGPRKKVKRIMTAFLTIVIVTYLALVGVFYIFQRSLLYFPSHREMLSDLAPWRVENQLMGFCREVQDPRIVWLMMHGNAGQAAHRDYVLARMDDRDALYVLEYPGYGTREGQPGLDSINAAAASAYAALQKQYPGTRIGLIGESLGSGPACVLASSATPPAGILLVVPFDSLQNLAATHFSWLPARLLVKDRWNNITALSGYKGPIQIFAAPEDDIIPFARAEALAKSHPNIQLTKISGGHNDWSIDPTVRVDLP